MLNDIKDHLKGRHETLAVAESVTSGHLQAAFSAAKEASLFFQGGITTYNLGQKCRHLDIEPVQAESCKCVSVEVANQMALQCCKLFLSHYSIGITGYATKMPEQGVTELFAYYSIAYKNKIIDSGKLPSKEEEAVAVQLNYTHQVIERLYKVLREK